MIADADPNNHHLTAAVFLHSIHWNLDLDGLACKMTMMSRFYSTGTTTAGTRRSRITTFWHWQQQQQQQQLLILCLLFSSLTFSAAAAADLYYPQFGLVDGRGNDPHPPTYDYVRNEHVCQSVLATAADLEPDDNRLYAIQNELSFISGGWEQSPGNAPLMPFSNASSSTSNSPVYLHPPPSKLVSFWITHVASRRSRKNNYISVSGVLVMGITSNPQYGAFYDRPYEQNPEFHMFPGHSEISIVFQGIYAESRPSANSKEERVVCLLGNALLPSRQVETGSFDDQPSLLQDDQILLLLHYPKTLSLTNVVITGELKSLNSKDSPKYFNDIHIVSHLSFSLSSNYASSEKILSKACNSYSNGDSCKTAATDVYKQSKFCLLLNQLSKRKHAFTVVPNWKCIGTDDYCSKLGPFMGDREINATDGSFKGVGIFMQDVRCEQTTSKDGVTYAKVFAIFRAASETGNSFYVASRSGLNNMTVVAEGNWSSSTGHLCMIACLGIINSEENCNSRACLYIPLTFSIKQRSILVGSFSSLSNSAKTYFPLSFERVVKPNELWQFQSAKFQYKYSKIVEAGTVLEKDQPFSFGNVIKKSLMNFPKLQNNASNMASISFLSEDLRFHTSAMPDPTSSGNRIPRIDIQMDIISLGPVLGRGQAWGSYNISTADDDAPNLGKTEYTERQILLNVSAQLTISSKAYSNLSVIFLEGIYDPHVGKMYLIGCRDVRASWKILHESMDLEDGLDCQIEAVVSYPPTTVRWFMNPTAKIFVSSKRNEDDPLHFPEMKLQTLPLLYRMQREDILSHRGVEGILRILTLTMTVAFILSQLVYMRQSKDAVPFISLVMLGVQVLGYSLHLVTGAEAILGGMASKSSYNNSSYGLEKNNWLKLIDYCVKLLVLVSFLLTLRLSQRVWKSRSRLLSSTSLEPRGIPSDRRVMIIIFITHLVGYSTVVIMNVSHSKKPLGTEIRYIDDSRQTSGWDTQLEEYVGLVQDFFLLPQIIGNLIWQTHCKPLRKLYYIGVTAVRVLPHVYDYFRVPIPNPYFSEDREFVNPALDFYSKAGNIFIPTMAFIFTVIVYIQQKWGYEKIGETLTIDRLRILPSASRAYQQLPTKLREAELVPAIGNDSHHQERHDDDDEE